LVNNNSISMHQERIQTSRNPSSSKKSHTVEQHSSCSGSDFCFIYWLVGRNIISTASIDQKMMHQGGLASSFAQEVIMQQRSSEQHIECPHHETTTRNDS
jgi:hypothetical protein